MKDLRQEAGIVSQETINLLRQQRTVRKYQERVPDDALIMDCIAIAQRSPSTSNHQPYNIIRIRDEALRNAVLAEMVCQPYVFEAPILLMVCVDWSRQDALAQELGVPNEINRPSKLVVGVADASIFAHSLVLALQASGLAASYIASPYTGLLSVARLLNIPPDQAMPLHMISVGYAAESPAPRPRYSLQSVYHEDQYTGPSADAVREYFHKGSNNLESQGYFSVTGDPISSWREHYKIKFGDVAKDRTWSPFARDLQQFFVPAADHDPR